MAFTTFACRPTSVPHLRSQVTDASRARAQVANFNDASTINAFHVASGAPPPVESRVPYPTYLTSSVNFLHQVGLAAREGGDL